VLVGACGKSGVPQVGTPGVLAKEHRAAGRRLPLRRSNPSVNVADSPRSSQAIFSTA
jgi:hypothetical protein